MPSIKPVHYKVLLKQHEIASNYKTKDGTQSIIAMPAPEKTKEQWKVSLMEVIDVGGAAFTDWGSHEQKPTVGDWVITREYAGFKVVGKDGQEYQLCTDEDILAITEAP